MSNYDSRLKPYNSYSGCDMVATLQVSSYSGLKNNIYTLGSLQTISISTHQDKRPVRSLGNINAKEYTMGQRTIAGSLVFAVFDKHFADQMFKDSLSSINQTENSAISTIMLPDELPPFDITISYANEYGHTSRMALYGVRLVNEGQVMSINDIYTENTYQFVATALEPLNKDENIGQAQKSNSNNQIESPARSLLNLTEDINTIIKGFDDDADLHKKDKVYLSVQIENPNVISGTGIARFSLDPKQKTGEIKIHGPYNKLYTINIEEYPNSKTYSINLPSGNYYAFFESYSKISNTVTFKIAYEELINNNDNNAPVIEYITDKEACIISNNITHDMAACYLKEINSELSREIDLSVPIATTALKSRKAIFTSLSPNTLYEFQTFNSVNSLSSMSTQSKTLKYDMELLDEFKNYITLNQEILVNDLDDLIEVINQNMSSVRNVYNIIDFALNIKREDDNGSSLSIIDEIVFFAVKFQNHINYDLNKYCNIQQPIKSLSSPYYNTIDLPNNIDYCNIFKTDRGKSIFKEKIQKVKTYEYIDKPNLRYYAYGINNSSRGPKYDFVCFSSSSKNELANYSSCNELASLSTDVIHRMYPGISNVNTTRMAAEYFKESNIEYLPKPMVIVNQDLTLDVYLNYKDYLSSRNEIILCFCEASESLDTTPKKKIRFNYIDKLSISSFYSGIKFNSSYAVWVENSEGFIVSKVETFNTYLNNQDILIEDDNIKTKQLEREINSIKTRLNKKVAISAELNEILESEKYNSDSHESIIYDNIISNIIYNKSVLSDSFTLISKLLEVKSDKDIFITNNFNARIKYNQKDRTVKFLCDKNIRISNTYIDDLTGDISKSISMPKDNTIQLNNRTGYNVLFCIADGLYANSGFIIIDNSTKNYYYYNIKAEVI